MNNPDDPSASESGEAAEETIRLDQFLQIQGVAGTGGQAKGLIQTGQVIVNGILETRRRRQLRPGDVVAIGAEEFVVEVE